MQRPRTSDRPIVLLVDDEPSCLPVLTAALGSVDCQLVCAAKPADALKLAQDRKPHLVLLDVMMPDMDGFTLCRRLREQAPTQDLAIIFLSSLQDPQDRTKGIELGAVNNRLQQTANVRFGLYPAPASKPVFLVDAGQESFYDRAGPGTRKLTMSQMLWYAVERGRI
jgi:CheY-like chemotaxis protein